MIDWFDNRAQHERLRRDFHAALDRVLDSGQLILGENVRAFEEEFARWNGSAYAIGVANGTDALVIVMRCLGIGPGDEVITVANTAVPTVNAICQVGARPVFAEIRKDTFLMDPEDLRRRLTPRTRAVLPVHLYGNPADMPGILAAAESAGVPVIEDCCQAHGATLGPTRVGNFGAAGCFSFYPTKNIGALGDGGVITTSDAALAGKIQRWRFYGCDDSRTSVDIGQNSRLDELQAAFLRVKLRLADDWLARRRALAARYADELIPAVPRQAVTRGGAHAWHLFVVRAPLRAEFQRRMAQDGIRTGLHYPTPVFDHPAYAGLNRDLPVTQAVARENVSLPMYPELAPEQVSEVCRRVNRFFKETPV